MAFFGGAGGAGSSMVRDCSQFVGKGVIVRSVKTRWERASLVLVAFVGVALASAMSACSDGDDAAAGTAVAKATPKPLNMLSIPVAELDKIWGVHFAFIDHEADYDKPCTPTSRGCAWRAEREFPGGTNVRIFQYSGETGARLFQQELEFAKAYSQPPAPSVLGKDAIVRADDAGLLSGVFVRRGTRYFVIDAYPSGAQYTNDELAARYKRTIDLVLKYWK